jgi:hypothetical protein
LIAAEALFWPEYKDAGWLSSAVWKAATFDAFFVKPGQVTANGALSTGYEIVYQDADAPALKEGDTITVDGVKFKVRDTPYVSDQPGDSQTGYFKHARLSSVK